MTEASAGQPPRSAEAHTAPAAARVDHGRMAQPSGWWGMALFLCAEVTLFGTMIGSYYYLNFGSRRWPPAGIQPPSIALPLAVTAVLVASTPLLVAAELAARRGHRARTAQWIVIALLIQVGFLAAQIALFVHDYNQFTPQSSAYGSIYFTLLAAHDAHVLLGILLSLAVLWKLATRGLNNYWLIGVRGLTLYWYVVNALALIVVLVVLSPSI
ncbi:MAG: heme-copper oxidase subunit III [Solirubrobacteraceae bacterium]